MTDLRAQFTRPELDAVASATADLSDFEAIVALADRLPLRTGKREPVRLTVTFPERMIRSARMGLTGLTVDDEQGEVVCSFLDRFDTPEARR